MEREALLKEGKDGDSSGASEASRETSIDTPIASEDDGMYNKNLAVPSSISSRKLWIYAVAVLVTFDIFYLLQSRPTVSQEPIQASEKVEASERVNVPLQAFFQHLYEQEAASPGLFPLHVQRSVPEDLCQICDCHASPSFYSPVPDIQQEFPPRPRAHDIEPTEDNIDANEMIRTIILDTYCARQHLTLEQASKLLRRSRKLEDVMSWSFGDLQLDRPTIYLTTVTSPNGKAGVYRPQFFRRNGRAIRSWLSTSKDAIDKAGDTGFQVVWIVAEDEVEIDPQVHRTLRRTGVPYIYFAYGLTKSWGNAQKNAVLQITHALSPNAPNGGLLGHGPIYGLDDDNKILPDFLGMLIKLQRIGVFKIGNLGLDGWEGPEISDDTGRVTHSNSPFARKFAFDYGAYAYNSSLLGTVISGPSFWKWTQWGGETEFMEQVVGDVRDTEPLCSHTSVQDCHFVWHNEPLTELQMMTDDEEIAYVKKYGAEYYFRELGMESVRSDKGGTKEELEKTGGVTAK